MHTKWIYRYVLGRTEMATHSLLLKLYFKTNPSDGVNFCLFLGLKSEGIKESVALQFVQKQFTRA